MEPKKVFIKTQRVEKLRADSYFICHCKRKLKALQKVQRNITESLMKFQLQTKLSSTTLLINIFLKLFKTS